MKRYLFTALFAAAMTFSGYHSAVAADNSTKHERNYIAAGNKLFKDKRFAEAEVQYRKALEENPNSDKAQYNLAASLIRQSGSADPNSGNNPLNEAARLLRDISQQTQDIELAEKAFYNLGNMAFNQEQYQQSIEMYKNALRQNPDNDKTRENLRLAQIKLKEQQDNQDNQNDQNKDQNQQQQQQQQQNQNNDQDQNQDNKNDQDQKKDEDQQKQQGDKKNDNQQQQPQQQQGGISDANAEKILKAMENEESATRRRVEAERRKEQQSNRRQILKPW